MENQLHFFLVFLSTLVFATTLTVALRRRWLNSKLKDLPYPRPPTLPLIGNLHLFIGSIDQPHSCLARLAHKYGRDVMLLQMGQVPTAVVSSPEAAKHVMKTQDSVFSERPPLYAAQSLTYNFKDIVFARGDYWRKIRKICVVELLSPKRVQSFRAIREEEIANLVGTIKSNANVASPVNLKMLLYSSNLNILPRAAFGGDSNHKDAFKELIPEMVALFGGLSVVDLYPSLRTLFGLIQALKPKHKRLHQKVDKILESVIQEHRRATTSAAPTGQNHVDHSDFVQILLDIQDRGEDLDTSSIKAIILDMFLAGAEPSSTIVEWTMSELLRNPQVLEKAQAEVRHSFAGTRDVVNEEGIHKLKYLNVVIKETLRLHPPAPLLIPRESQEECEVNGCVIPAKCRVIVNAWAIGRNQNYWSEADKFCPERFSDSSISYKGTDFELIPFGAGRRICPGMLYGMANVELILANLLYHFDWKLPNGMKPQDLDMTEVFGASLRRKQDLCLVPIPYCYEQP